MTAKFGSERSNRGDSSRVGSLPLLLPAAATAARRKPSAVDDVSHWIRISRSVFCFVYQYFVKFDFFGILTRQEGRFDFWTHRPFQFDFARGSASGRLLDTASSKRSRTRLGLTWVRNGGAVAKGPVRDSSSTIRECSKGAHSPVLCLTFKIEPRSRSWLAAKHATEL